MQQMIDRATNVRYKLMISALKDFAKEHDLVFEVREEGANWFSLNFRIDNYGYARLVNYSDIKSPKLMGPYIEYIKRDVLDRLSIGKEEEMNSYKKPQVYEHKNGYTARLYGKSSMSVYFCGSEVLHTASRNVNTEDEVMKLLAGMPDFFKAI